MNLFGVLVDNVKFMGLPARRALASRAIPALQLNREPEDGLKIL